MSNNITYNNPLIYGVEFQARSLCSLHADNDQDCFLIGTQSLVTSNNQVHLVKLQGETNILCPQIYEHSYGEIWSLASSPTDKHLIYTCYASIEQDCEKCTALWQLPEDDGNLENIITFHRNVTMFHPTNDAYMCSVIDNNIAMWDVGESGVKIVCTAVLYSKGQPRFTTGKWNPQNVNLQFVTADDCYIKAWDEYNPEHDKLIGTISSDGQVLITCLAGNLSSAVEIEDMKTKFSIDDKIVTTCDQLEDSVY